MKKLFLSAFALSGLILASASVPAFAADSAAHHHARHHDGKGKKKSKVAESKKPASDELNAASLHEAQTPVAPKASEMPSNMPAAPAEN